jgi:hypothetical protein
MKRQKAVQINVKSYGDGKKQEKLKIFCRVQDSCIETPYFCSMKRQKAVQINVKSYGDGKNKKIENILQSARFVHRNPVLLQHETKKRFKSM